jgi:maltose alpha-D-glucosyltransferase/alpha-amylase
VRSWTDRLVQRAHGILEELARRQSALDENIRPMLGSVLAHRERLPALLRELMPDTIDAVKIRHHGDLHLGQMLIVRDDVFIIDFEGEPRRSIEERRQKAPAARDVAGLIRSMDYAATAALERALKIAPDEQGKIARALDDWR